MLIRLLRLQKGSLLLASTALLAIAGCSSPTAQAPPLTPTPSPTISATPTPAPPPQISDAEIYNQALNKASSAQNLSQGALSSDDWNLVASRWQQAVDELKTLPTASPYRTLAKDKLSQYEKSLAAAQKRAEQAKTTEGRTTPGTLAGSQPLDVSGGPTSAGAGKVFRAKIKRRAGGTPIIDVTFNGSQTFEMIVDTGASGTVITSAMANALGVRIIGQTRVNTASQAGVVVPLAYVDSIAVGQAVVKDVIVAIGNDSLDIGLLGHDFFSDYDVTVKQDVVEFRKR